MWKSCVAVSTTFSMTLDTTYTYLGTRGPVGSSLSNYEVETTWISLIC